jgi:hypothetical protein
VEEGGLTVEQGEDQRLWMGMEMGLVDCNRGHCCHFPVFRFLLVVGWQIFRTLLLIRFPRIPFPKSSLGSTRFHSLTRRNEAPGR